MSHDISPIARAIAAGALLSVFVLSDPSPAAAASGQLLVAQSTATAPGAAATPRAPARKAAHMSPAARVEARITDLHANLHITAAQETQWSAVAQAMRGDAQAIETIAGDRRRKIKTMSAVDDLRSYASLSEAHADGMTKLVAAFGPLYDGMSDSQKATADTLFRHHPRRHSAAKKS